MNAIADTGLRLVKTCSVAPEQYDVLDADDKVVGYLRLRYGRFTAQVGDAGGPLVYSHDWPGDQYKGCFDTKDEADEHLEAAIRAIAAHRQPRTEWDTTQLREDFEVVGFQAPYVVVIRKADRVKGSLEFTHMPRKYFNFVAY